MFARFWLIRATTSFSKPLFPEKTQLSSVGIAEGIVVGIVVGGAVGGAVGGGGVVGFGVAGGIVGAVVAGTLVGFTVAEGSVDSEVADGWGRSVEKVDSEVGVGEGSRVLGPWMVSSNPLDSNTGVREEIASSSSKAIPRGGLSLV